MDSLNELKEKIQSLETERARLSNEVEALRKAAEARAMSLERDVGQLREEELMLREILEEKEDAGYSFTPSKTIVQTSAPLNEVKPSPIPQPMVEETPKTIIDEENVPITSDSLNTLSVEERKVIEVLSAHGGRVAQKDLRAEAGLSWLQANRIVSHLSTKGTVNIEKNGGLIEVVLKKTI